MNTIIKRIVIGALLIPGFALAQTEADIYESTYLESLEKEPQPVLNVVPNYLPQEEDVQLINGRPLIEIASADKSSSLKDEEINKIIQSFEMYKDVKDIDIRRSAVVELPLENTHYKWADSFVVLENETNSFIPYLYTEDVTVKSSRVTASKSSAGDYTSKSAAELLDNNNDTFIEYYYFDSMDKVREAEIYLKSVGNITLSTFSILLGEHIALPSTVMIEVVDFENNHRVVLPKSSMSGQTVIFPETEAHEWKIILEYIQPLRITELKISPKKVLTHTTRQVRFVAKPNHTYRIYFDPDRYVDVNSWEVSNLQYHKDVLTINSVASLYNPAYTPVDIDEDGIPDHNDNCVLLFNPVQLDIDENGLGDLCDDVDNDFKKGKNDNCPNQSNSNQIDTDRNGRGDVCDNEVWWLVMGFTSIIIIIAVVFTILRMKDYTKDE